MTGLVSVGSNGVTTTFEALWMNIPVLVLKGNNFISRAGASIIKNSNQDYLIANNRNEKKTFKSFVFDAAQLKREK